MVCGKEVPANLKPDRKTQLDDVTSAFYFSRLPREERIAKTMYEILTHEWCVLECNTIYDNGAIVLKITSAEDLMSLAKSLELYARKDFAVRYGRIDG